MSRKNTELVVFNFNKQNVGTVSLKLNNEKIRTVNKFKYLRFVTMDNADVDKDIIDRISIG